MAKRPAPRRVASKQSVPRRRSAVPAVPIVADVIGLDCYAHCPACAVDFRIGASVPCPIKVYIAALKAARCPRCGTHDKIQAYSPGLTPAVARGEKGYGLRFGL